MAKIEVWVNYEGLLKYMNGDTVIAWSDRSTKENIKLIVPLVEVVNHHDWGDEGVEINIKQV